MAKTIADYQNEYKAARAKGDSAGMQAANSGANAIRKVQGQTQQFATTDIGKVTGGQSGLQTPTVKPAVFRHNDGINIKPTPLNNIGKVDAPSTRSRGVGTSIGGGIGSAAGGPLGGVIGGILGGLVDKVTGGTSGNKPSNSGSTGGATTGGNAVGNGGGSNGYTQKYTGGNAALDSALAGWGQKYQEARANGDMYAMQHASNEANKLRNQYGYAAEDASADIGKFAGDGGNNQGNGFAPGINGQENLYTQWMEEQQRQYDEILAQQENAKRLAIEQAVGQLNSQKAGVGQSYDDLYRQLYIDRRKAEQGLPQQMAAMGLSGGMTESTALGLQTSYAEALREGEQEKLNTLNGIDQAIADTRFSGDISIAEQAAQTAKDRLVTYGNIIAAMQGQQNWAQEYGYKQAMDERDFNYQKEQDTKTWTYREAQDELARKNTSFERKLSAAQYLYENTGDASGLKMLGYSDSQIAALGYSYAAAMKAKKKPSGRSGMSLTTAKQAAGAGVFDDTVISVLKKNGYTDSMLEAIYGYAPSTVKGDDGPNVRPEYLSVQQELSELEDRGGGTLQEIARHIESAFKAHRITWTEKEELYARYGLGRD